MDWLRRLFAPRNAGLPARKRLLDANVEALRRSPAGHPPRAGRVPDRCPLTFDHSPAYCGRTHPEATTWPTSPCADDYERVPVDQ